MRSEFTNQSSPHSAWSNGSISPVVRLKFCAAGGLDRERADSDAVLSLVAKRGNIIHKRKAPYSTGSQPKVLEIFHQHFFGLYE